MINFFCTTVVIINLLCSINPYSKIPAEFKNSTKNYKTEYLYNLDEIEILALINDNRTCLGLNELQKIDYASFRSEEHNNYMMKNNIVAHNNFTTRSGNIIDSLEAKNVSEIIAYNYHSPQGVMNAWQKNANRKNNIEGDFTDCGISVRQNPDTGKKYYTVIFIKL